ncbi:MAG: GNAT family N-acetyltransferase [Candidatus Cohnella colombiensis]|uniref:GNAT family N-acetyltransferase n=1 Tax=Candidatus Cohnella colombiensis TaxID=3121368 RepID=A0AA95EW79_9BACL|nr:MAG: GNAT family N-acetyltransferase [Cohnella sp.]
MVLRQLRTEEFDQSIALSQFAFQFVLPADMLEDMRKKFKPDDYWGIFDESDRLTSKLILLPLQLWVQGRTFAMGGIAGVASWPEARRQGGVKQLLLHALETMRANGQSVSMLHPFAFPFYHKFGWEFTIERKQYTIPVGLLPPRVQTEGRVARIAKQEVNAIFAVIDPVYATYASQFSGTLVRNVEWWENRILNKAGEFAVYYNEAGKAEGYVFCEVASRKMTIHEWVNVTETARLALWTYVSNHDSMIDEVVMKAPVEDPLPFLLSNPRIKQEIEPYFMSRIVDAEAFIGEYPWMVSNQDETLVIRLSDKVAAWNEGLFRLTIAAEGTAVLSRIDPSEETVQDAACDIQTLTALLLGGRSATLLAETGRLQANGETVALFERRIPRRQTYLMDFF